MRSPVIPVIIIFTLILIIDLYVFKGLRYSTNLFSNKYKPVSHIIYWSIPLIVIISVILFFVFQQKLSYEFTMNFFYSLIGFIAVIYIPKLLFIIFHLIEDIIRLLAKIAKALSSADSTVYENSNKISRIKFITQTGLILSSIPFISLLWGIVKGRFNFKVEKLSINFPNLPKSFDGFRIAQISDMHIGSFKGRKEKVEYAVKLINEQKPDIIVFTGDMVNNLASELDEWEDILSKMKAKVGKYSVLGNHDYGDYYPWKSKNDKSKNLISLIEKQKQIGFELLKDESFIIEHNKEKIAIIGVENWGKGGFPKIGDYEKASQGLDNIPFKILLSHDPSHWDEKIKDKTNVDLCLSGHTHGMQMGIDIFGFRWSPVKFRYPHWRGLYNHNKQYLYVNIGFGFVGYPGRVGTPPEITIIDLKSNS